MLDCNSYIITTQTETETQVSHVAANERPPDEKDYLNLKVPQCPQSCGIVYYEIKPLYEENFCSIMRNWANINQEKKNWK